ncbi:hypothetical protein BAUCODRAFT_64417 [Baudoinia panamericana UAMH 10762]|uniref:Uncharacterized protein n=1 Tax=Baudoinia panamericana (strain UAMH 10762) TaxID=717646 RepID=M2NHT8_BAUPA|nr:uncharacterized protein BAUCODRAFT_64417 [Baudoinia panamericana UAMH 10762]EMC98620.1 hypothetical protein BAUCODRAFT_64417 [Baudoinia panamericana UAMH 10762]
MRFQDWDVLIFSAGSQVPLREFRTACFAQAENMSSIPVLTCFMPSLSGYAPFTVSVHSWTKPSILGSNNAGYVPSVVYQWRVKLVIDGVTVATETYPEDVQWPRQIDSCTAADAEGKRLALRFPRFHRSIMSQTHWNACDDLGRIKIQLSAGYELVEQGSAKFVKILDHVVFSFQPAPLGMM